MNNENKREFEVIEKSSSSELNSPFYLKNKAYCKSWKAYMDLHEGKIEYDFTAWALAISAHVPNKLKLKISSAQISNPGLFVKSKKSRIDRSTIEFSVLNKFTDKIQLKRKGMFDQILGRKILLNKFSYSANHVDSEVNRLVKYVKIFNDYHVEKIIAKEGMIHIVVYDLISPETLDKVIPS